MVFFYRRTLNSLGTVLAVQVGYFFAVLTTVFLGSLTLMLKDQVNTFEYACMLYGVIITAFLYVTTFRKHLFQPLFWIITLAIYLLFCAIFIFLKRHFQITDISNQMYLVTLVVGWLITLPTLIGFFNYALKWPTNLELFRRSLSKSDIS